MSKVTVAAQVDMMADVLRDPCTLRLYVNETLPSEPTAADFEELKGAGYGGRAMRAAAWDMSRAPEEAVFPRQKWTFDGPAGRVYGWFVTRNSDGRLRWYEPFVDENGDPAPMRVINPGDEISVGVILGLGSKTTEPTVSEE